MKYFSMFTGIGGFELGIDNAYLVRHEKGQAEGSQNQHSSDTTSENGAWGEQRPLCVGYSEIDKYAIATYEKNFGKEIKNYGDATTINTAELPDFDLLVGGFPCQAFSVAGKRAGFNDTRGTLIFDVVRILRDKRPRYFVLENVKGLLSHDSGKTFSHILEILTDSGYDVSWSVHNSKNYGVPQNRERIYLIGSLRGERRPQVFPITADSGQALKQIVSGSQGNRVYGSKGISSTIASQAGGLGAKTGLYAIPVLTPDRIEKRQNGRRFKENGEPSFTLNTQDRHGVAIDLTRRAEDNHRVRKDGRVGTLDANYYKGLANQERPGVKEGLRIRRLTPTECERLQGFPDGWTIGSDTQRYKQCGNAVTVNVVEHVVSEMFNPTQS